MKWKVNKPTIEDCFEKPSSELSITQPEATLTIQQLMNNVIDYQRAYRDGNYLDDSLSDNDAFGMIDVDSLDLCEIQQLRDKIDDKVKQRFTKNSSNR